MTHKICKKCGILKEISEFYKMPRAKDGTRNECKTCVREQAKQHQISKGGDYMRNIHLRRNFNINLEEYRELLKKQDYKCLICGIDRKDVDIDFAVDHNHVTGRISC